MKLGWLAGGVLAVGLGSLGALGAASPSERTVAEFRTSLEGRSANQRHNAWLAAKTLNGKVINPDAEFSFNQTFGGWTRDRGYRRAPVSYNGTLIDAWGGGVCQTSSTLYNTALLAGLTIDERHAHHFAPGYVAPGRDAAVAYPNIDLRFRNPYPKSLTIHAKIEGDAIVVQLRGQVKPGSLPAIRQRVVNYSAPMEVTVGQGKYGRVRAPGKPGWSIETYRIQHGRTERLSVDTYPSMPRVVEYSAPH